LKLPSEAFIAVPVPFVQPALSMKYSAAATLLRASVSVVVTVGGAFVGLALTAVFEVTGPVVSHVTVLSVEVEAVLPLPAAS
jgi:hypothetical protein